MTDIIIKKVEEDEWLIWQSLRLEALQNHPDVFLSSPEEEKNLTENEIRKGLRNRTFFGVYHNSQLVGFAGLAFSQRQKAKHNAHLIAVYLSPAYRGQGHAKKLISTMLDFARQFVSQIFCGVIVGNETALKLYQNLGFRIYGIEPKAIKIGDVTYDNQLMVFDYGC